MPAGDQANPTPAKGQPMTDSKPEAPPETSDVMLVVRTFSRCFDDFDTDRFISLWDDQASLIVYQPEELHSTIFNLSALRAYFASLPNVIRGFRDTKVIDLRSDITGDTATVFVRFWTRISFAREARVLDGQIRQTFLLRRRDNRWKLVHYHESRQVPGLESVSGDW
jgi:ketosteroid isomerase-like protein